MSQIGSNNKELAGNKLILLYIIEKVNIPVSNLQITKLIMENDLMDYFSLQQYLNELCDDNLLYTEVENNKMFYTITALGKKTLKYLDYLIPAGAKYRIDTKIRTIRQKIRNETSITADFIPESEDKYMVHCSVLEDDFTLIEINMAVGNRNDARNICENWKNHPHQIYMEIIESLTTNRE